MNKFITGLERYLNNSQLAKIGQVKIGIAGAGGLGSNCAAMLARSGFKKFKIVDFDTIDPSNLNRQFYFLSQVGRLKVEALRDNLMAINPQCEIDVVSNKINVNNINEMFFDCHVVVEAFDRAEYKTMIIEAYAGSDKLLVVASGLAGWGDSDRIRVRRITDRFFVVGDMKTGIDAGCPPLAPCVSIAAAKQADVILTYVLGTIQGGRGYA